MRLGGWARIWIVLCVIYAALVMVIAYDSRPNLQRIQRDWLFDASAKIAEGISSAEGRYISAYDVERKISDGDTLKGIEWLKRVEAKPGKDQEAIPAAVAPINAKYQARIDGLAAEKTRFWAAVAAWWLGGCFFLFVIGWTIGWVVRGFRKGAA